MHPEVIVDTSVLIALEKCDLLYILFDIYETVILLEAIVKEYGKINLPCIVFEKVTSPLLNLLLNNMNLGKGEAEVIAYAINSKTIPILVSLQDLLLFKCIIKL